MKSVSMLGQWVLKIGISGLSNISTGLVHLTNEKNLPLIGLHDRDDHNLTIRFQHAADQTGINNFPISLLFDHLQHRRGHLIVERLE